jgi:transcription factor SFP1
MAAINAAQNGMSVTAPAIPSSSTSYLQSPPPMMPAAKFQQHPQHGDAPTPPGMMDLEMDESMLSSDQTPMSGLVGGTSSSPWASAFRSQLGSSTPQGVPPSLLSFTPSGQPPGLVMSQPLTFEQLQAKALKKAQRKAERIAREETAVSDVENDKRFPCPIEGCGKVYKQANGLKYHLTRSINSGHGNVAALGLAALLGDRPSEGNVG